MDIERLLEEDIIRDPESLGKLERKGDLLICTQTGTEYPIIKNRPILRSNPETVVDMEDHESHPIPEKGVQILEETKGKSCLLGPLVHFCVCVMILYIIFKMIMIN